MELTFPWPLTEGEWLAWSSAAFTILLGLLLLFAPGLSLKIVRLQAVAERPEGLAEARGPMAGFYLGVGLCCILLAQPLIYLTLSFCWLFAAFGRIISMLSDRGGTLYNWFALVVELVLAALPLAFYFGFLP